MNTPKQKSADLEAIFKYNNSQSTEGRWVVSNKNPTKKLILAASKLILLGCFVYEFFAIENYAKAACFLLLTLVLTDAYEVER